MIRVLVGFVACSLLAFSAGVALADGVGDNAQASINLHVGPVLTKGACEAGAVPCDAVVVLGGLVPQYHYVYALVENGSDSTGIAGVEFGIHYNGTPNAGVDIFGWTLCADLEFSSDSPLWPADGSGNLITWDSNVNCQLQPQTGNNEVVAVAGYFYLGAYSPDCLATTPRPASGRAKVANCANVETIISGKSASHLGIASFGGAGCAYRPCAGPTPVENKTWGGIKATYGNN